MKIPAESSKNTFIPEKTAKNTGRAVQSSVNITTEAAKLATVQGKPSALSGNTAENLTNLLSALKLPQDNLSRSIIAFARYFSLPLDSKFLASLRREALNLPGGGAAAREAVVLGAAAALDKGIKLDKKALAEYAAAIEGSMKSFTGKSQAETPVNPAKPEDRHNDGEGGGQSGQGNSPGTEGGGSHREGEHGGHGFLNNGQKQQENPQKQITGGNLQRQVTEILKDRHLLDMINRIPGKKGRWIVIPFSFYQKSFEFNVSLRILLSDTEKFSGKPAVAERLAVDIAVKRKAGETEGEARWFICLERPKSAPAEETAAFSPESRVKVFSETETRSAKGKGRFNKEQLRREAAKALNMPLEQVEIMEKPLLFADSREDILRLVNEEV